VELPTSEANSCGGLAATTDLLSALQPMCDSIGEKTLFADCAHVVIGVETILMAGEAKLRVIAIEAGKTLML